MYQFKRKIISQLIKIILFIIVFISFSECIIFAHSGRTDSNGGHWDYSTGTYHYHNSGSNSTHSFTIPNNDDELIAELEEKNKNLENKISKYKNSLEEYGYNSIDEMENKIDSLDTQIDNMWSGFFIVGLIVICISYNIGASKNNK